MYSHRTGDVVTAKAAAGVWAATKFPQSCQLIGLANRSYAGLSTDKEREEMQTDVKDLLVFAHQQIQRGLTR